MEPQIRCNKTKRCAYLNSNKNHKNVRHKSKHLIRFCFSYDLKYLCIRYTASLHNIQAWLNDSAFDLRYLCIRYAASLHNIQAWLEDYVHAMRTLSSL